MSGTLIWRRRTLLRTCCSSDRLVLSASKLQQRRENVRAPKAPQLDAFTPSAAAAQPTTKHPTRLKCSVLIGLACTALAAQIRHVIAALIGSAADELADPRRASVNLFLSRVDASRCRRDCTPLLLRVELQNTSALEMRLRGISEQCHMLSNFDSSHLSLR